MACFRKENVSAEEMRSGTCHLVGDDRSEVGCAIESGKENKINRSNWRIDSYGAAKPLVILIELPVSCPDYNRA